jgi:hypothetical protein
MILLQDQRVKCTTSSSLHLKDKQGDNFTLDPSFIEWLTGFTDGEGNFKSESS